jgi:hypothetical protein
MEVFILMNPKFGTVAKAGTVAALVTKFFLLAVSQAAQAQQSGASQTKHWKVSNAAARRVKCKLVGNWDRCYSFDSDSTRPQGLPDYHGSS